ncbi:DUF1192 domain-containing protein [Acuticoccus sp. MNP-M23]|uniref:DUF1192 domain-containing protein n=1 Tax=Acuticoccus sp. MNP-M23 TaxID=3072793 RepID=UPI0028154ADA|nr:DUF1192 domain-containing protein [Acuticoccus sp. MNP-M23]WMS43201.1 DUF1192 domain-containing protein [Acuticoccus sp. MNP-M23]
MNEDDARPKALKPGHTIGADLSRVSVDELHALRQACLDEASRIEAEINAKDATRVAAASVFKF